MDGPVDVATLPEARELIASTTATVDTFATELEAAFALGPLPEPGSCRALTAGVSLAKLCRTFARNWAAPPGTTPARVAEYNRDVALLRAVLDEYATNTSL